MILIPLFPYILLFKSIPSIQKISNLFHSHISMMYWDYANELDMDPH